MSALAAIIAVVVRATARRDERRESARKISERRGLFRHEAEHGGVEQGAMQGPGYSRLLPAAQRYADATRRGWGGKP